MVLVSWFVWIITAAFVASKKTTSAAATTIKRQECRNGQFTLHYETDRIISVLDIEWFIKFKDTVEWMFSRCSYFSNVINCEKIKKLPVGMALLDNSNGAVTIASSRNSTHDYAEIRCKVYYDDGYHSMCPKYNISLTAHCVRIQEGRDLNLTKILLEYRLHCSLEMEWYSINYSKFAYCRPYQDCKVTNDSNNPVPTFWDRLQVRTGSLFLTGIQSDDNKLEIRLKIYYDACETQIDENRVHTIWILVTSAPDSPVSEPNATYTPPNLILPTSKTGKSSKSSNDDVSMGVLPIVSVGSPTRSGALPSWSRGQPWTAIIVVTIVYLRTNQR